MNQQSKFDPVYLVVLFVPSLILIVVSGFVLRSGVQHYQLAKQSADWPVAPGTISNIQVVEEDDATEVPDTERWFTVKVEYDYNVDGTSHQSKRWTFGTDVFNDAALAESKAKEFELGQPVDVFYKPNDPVESVLQPGASDGASDPMFFGLVFLAVSLVICGIFLLLCRRRSVSLTGR